MLPTNSRILVVDDMSTMRKLIKKNLADLGYQDVVESADGDEAWSKISDALKTNQPIHLILSDWNMPRMKGVELLQKVRATSGTKSLPFILLTAESEKDQVAHALKAGANAYLQKPFTKEQLAEKIQAATERRAA